MLHTPSGSIISTFVANVFDRHERAQQEKQLVENSLPIVIDFIGQCEGVATGDGLRETLLREGCVTTEAEAAKVLHELVESGVLARARQRKGASEYFLRPKEEPGAANSDVNATKKTKSKDQGQAKPESQKAASTKPASRSLGIIPLPQERDKEIKAETISKDHLLPAKVQWLGEGGVRRQGNVIAFLPAGTDYAGQLKGLPGGKSLPKVIPDTPGYLVLYKGRIVFRAPSAVDALAYYNEDEVSVGCGGFLLAQKFMSLKRSPDVVQASVLTEKQEDAAALLASLSGKGFIQSLDAVRKAGFLKLCPVTEALLAKAENEVGFYEVQRNAISMMLGTRP